MNRITCKGIFGIKSITEVRTCAGRIFPRLRYSTLLASPLPLSVRDDSNAGSYAFASIIAWKMRVECNDADNLFFSIAYMTRKYINAVYAF